MTPSKRRILAPKKLSSQTCANYFLILETSFKVCGKNYSPVFCGSEIKCGLMLSEKGCRGLAANLTSKPRRFKAFCRTNLDCCALIVMIWCPTLLWKASLETGRAEQGSRFRDFFRNCAIFGFSSDWHLKSLERQQADLKLIKEIHLSVTKHQSGQAGSAVLVIKLINEMHQISPFQNYFHHH